MSQRSPGRNTLVPTETVPRRDKHPAVGTVQGAHPLGCAAPVLDQKPNGVGRRLAAIVGPGHPVRTFLTGVALSFVSIAAMSILLGLLVTKVIVRDGGIDNADESLVRFLSHHRSGGLTDASLIGSILAGGVVLPIIVGVCGILAALFKQWRLGAFLILALAVESGAYRATTLLVHRPRPQVHRLEDLPANASYPSGHTAASIAVYCGLALLLTSRISRLAPRVLIWAVAAAIPVYVAFARMYRGMHHPMDIVGGVVIGIAVLAAMVLVSRSTTLAAAERDGS
jgi:membrane-associated phospholipid phosphatase